MNKNNLVGDLVSSRAYTGPRDLQAMLALVKARPPDQVADFPGIIDLQEMLAVPKMQAYTRLWTTPAGQLAAFAILDGDQASAALIFEIASGWKDAGLEGQIMDWARTSIRQAFPAHASTFLLEASTSSDNPERITLLEGLGFERQSGGAVHMERSLADPIEEPQLPPGFLIRPIMGEAQAEAWVRLHRLALGTENMTTEYRLAMMRTPSYDPHMDLVAVTSEDGRLAAYCVCYINIEENALTGRRLGHTDPIATHPDFRRRGLSKALMLTGLSLLKERSMETACLGTSSDNIAMLHTAGSVGFRITKTVLWFKKPIHFG